MKYNFDEIVNRENTQCIKWDNRESVFGRRDVIPMWIADMDFKTPDFIIDALKKRLEHEVMAYVFRPDSFYESASKWIERRNGWQVNSKDMVFTPGVVPALEFAVEAYTTPGDKIVVQPPVYTPFFNAVKNHKRELVENPLIETNGYYTINFDDLEQKFADGAKMLIFCSPHNPVGRVWTKDELLRLGNLCVKYNVILIADEIHSDLIFKPHKHIHIAALSDKIAQLTLTCFAPSKTFNIAGLSTAMVHSANPEILDKFRDQIQIYHAHMGNIFGNIALETAYSHGDEWLDQLLTYLEGNIDWVITYLKNNIPEVKAFKNEGTYLMWLDFRAFNICQTSLKDFMINDAGLGLNCGEIFGKEGKGFMRLNVACPRQIIEKAMHQLKHAIDNKLIKRAN